MQEQGYYDQSFTFSYVPLRLPGSYYMALEMRIEYAMPFDFRHADIQVLLNSWLSFLQKERTPIKYGYADFYPTFVFDRPTSRRKAEIPDDKLMGAFWGNLITKQRLGKQPKVLLEEIEAAIAPEKIVEIAPELYWFNLPFSLASYSKKSDLEYHALRKKVIEIIKRHKVLWQRGTRRHYS